MVLDIGFASFMSGTVPMAGQPSKQINNDFPSKPLQYQKKNVPLHIRNNAAVAAIKNSSAD